MHQEKTMLSQSATRLSERIKKIIEDKSISVCSYEELMNLVSEDGMLDVQGKNLFRELHYLLDTGPVKWAPCGIN